MKHLIFLVSLYLCASWCMAQPYTIYPIPQKQEAMEGTLVLTPTITIVCDADIDAATRQRARQVLTEAGYSCKFAKKVSTHTSNLQLKTDANVAKEGKYDSHTLLINKEGICITGQHTNAVFFGLATLEQILGKSKDGRESKESREGKESRGSLPFVSITDYADLQNRGVVEGYYGFPYSTEVRQDLMRFMMRYKMNTYLYGGKSDPFHSQYWQQPYPETITAEQEKSGWMSQGQIRDVAQLSAESKVNFIWAIHPGDSIIDSPNVVDVIMGKFEKMHQLGIRQFALFVDDVFIPTEQADMDLTAQRVTEIQNAIEARWNRPSPLTPHSSLPQDTVRPLHFVPQIYCSGFADSDDQRIRFMKTIGQIPPQITVYTTGQWVWTVPNNEHTAHVREEFGRPMAWWWNYPCNDNADSQIYAMDMYSNFLDMPAVRSSSTLPSALTDNAGLVANPMQQGEVSKTPLFSVADYAWNNAAFNHKRSWEASFAAIVSDTTLQQSYRYVAEFLRWNEPQPLQKLEEIIVHCNRFEGLKNSSEESDRLLYNDLRPWLHILKASCQAALTLRDHPEKAEEIARNLNTNPDYSVTSLEGMGNGITTETRQAQVAQRYLQPIVDFLLHKTTDVEK